MIPIGSLAVFPVRIAQYGLPSMDFFHSDAHIFACEAPSGHGGVLSS
jgi:hypothetical protein